MFSFVTILLSAALFAAIIFILAGNFRFSKKATGIFMFLAVALGVPLYGAGYAHLSPDNLPLAVLRTCFSVCGMFLGRSDALLVADTPVYANPILAAGLWFACTCALCATASAAQADGMNADGTLAAEMVVFTTAASVITIFIGSFILKSLGLI